MIQDIYPHRLDNTYKADAAPKDSDKVVVYFGGDFLLKVSDKKIALPQVRDIPKELHDKLCYLFSIDDNAYFLLPEKVSVANYERHSITDVRKANFQPEYEVFALFTAYHLAEWYADNRFCGRCGADTVHDTKERAMFCPNCNKKVYPRINPAVIIGVINGDKILITRYNRGYAHNALVAGFTEIGETVEETVAREVMEEAGLKVKNIRYYKSQPWGVAADLLMGFYCEVDGDDTITMDRNELKYAEWVNRKDIVLQPLDYSLTNEMMKMFKEGKVR